MTSAKSVKKVLFTLGFDIDPPESLRLLQLDLLATHKKRLSALFWVLGAFGFNFFGNVGDCCLWLFLI